jgi:hypothetical protein
MPERTDLRAAPAIRRLVVSRWRPTYGMSLGGWKRRRLAPAWGESFTAAYGQPELACDTPRLPPERRRATGSPSGLDRPLDHPSGRDPTVPRTAGRTENGRSPDGFGGGRDSSDSCRGCTSSFTCLAWGPTGAIGTPGLIAIAPAPRSYAHLRITRASHPRASRTTSSSAMTTGVAQMG